MTEKNEGVTEVVQTNPIIFHAPLSTKTTMDHVRSIDDLEFQHSLRQLADANVRLIKDSDEETYSERYGSYCGPRSAVSRFCAFRSLCSFFCICRLRYQLSLPKRP